MEHSLQPKLQSVELFNGVTLEYVEQGNPLGVPVVMLHGVTDSWRSFEPVLPHLPASLHVFAVTQRGHGNANKPNTGYDLDDFAVDAAAFIDALNLGPVLVLGHSMGAGNAMRLATQYPERVMGLVLAGAFASYRRNAAVVEYWQTQVAPLADPIEAAFVRDFQQSTLAQSIPESLLETVVQESLKVPSSVWRATFEGFLREEAIAEFNKIRVPTLLISGGADGFCSKEDRDALREGIPDSRLIVYRDAGHAMHWEEPKRFAWDLTEFALEVSRPNKQRRTGTL